MMLNEVSLYLHFVILCFETISFLHGKLQCFSDMALAEVLNLLQEMLVFKLDAHKLRGLYFGVRDQLPKLNL